MVHISVDLKHENHKPQMVGVTLWALGQEGQVPGDGIIREVHGNRDLESLG